MGIMTAHPAPQDGDELRKAVLKAGTVRYATGSFTQKHYSNGTASPIEHKVQEIVEIGIEDLMQLFEADKAAAVREARLNLIDYFDQCPKNELMDWKNLFKDTRKLLEADPPHPTITGEDS